MLFSPVRLSAFVVLLIAGGSAGRAWAAPVLEYDAVTGTASVAPASPHLETELALRCYLGFGLQRCKKNYDDCDPVETVTYLGTNAAGAGLYEVQFMHRNGAYVVARDPHAKTGHYLVKGADPYWIKATVSSRDAPSLIYTRPKNLPVVSACGGDYGPPATDGAAGSADFLSPYHDSGYPAQSSARQP